MEKAITSILCFLSGVAFFLYGNDPTNIKWLVITLALIAIDLLLGVINAVYDKTFTRRLLLDGLRRKLGELVMIAVAHLVDESNILQGTLSLQLGVTGFILAYEAKSVLDKIKIGGSPIPQFFLDLLKKAIDKYSASGSGTDHTTK